MSILRAYAPPSLASVQAVDPATGNTYAPPSAETDFGAGVGAFGYNTGANLAGLGAGIADAAGAQQATKVLRKQAQYLGAKAQAKLAGRTTTWEQAAENGDWGGYAATTLGQGLPQIATTIAGGALAARVPGLRNLLGKEGAGYLGGMAANVPSEAGGFMNQLHDSPAAMQNSTAGQRLGSALVQGAGAAALDSLVDRGLTNPLTAGLRGQLQGGILGSAAKGFAKEGFTEGLTEAANIGHMRQYDDQYAQGEDFSRISNAALAGGITGGAVEGGSHMLGAVPNVLVGGAKTAAGALRQGAQDVTAGFSGQASVDANGQPVEVPASVLGQVGGAARTVADVTGKVVGAAKNYGAGIAEGAAKSKAGQYAKAKYEQFMATPDGKPLTPEQQKQRASEFTTKALDLPATYVDAVKGGVMDAAKKTEVDKDIIEAGNAIKKWWGDLDLLSPERAGATAEWLALRTIRGVQGGVAVGKGVASGYKGSVAQVTADKAIEQVQALLAKTKDPAEIEAVAHKWARTGFDGAGNVAKSSATAATMLYDFLAETSTDAYRTGKYAALKGYRAWKYRNSGKVADAAEDALVQAADPAAFQAAAAQAVEAVRAEHGEQGAKEVGDMFAGVAGIDPQAFIDQVAARGKPSPVKPSPVKPNPAQPSPAGMDQAEMASAEADRDSSLDDEAAAQAEFDAVNAHPTHPDEDAAPAYEGEFERVHTAPSDAAIDRLAASMANGVDENGLTKFNNGKNSLRSPVGSARYARTQFEVPERHGAKFSEDTSLKASLIAKIQREHDTRAQLEAQADNTADFGDANHLYAEAENYNPRVRMKAALETVFYGEDAHEQRRDAITALRALSDGNDRQASIGAAWLNRMVPFQRLEELLDLYAALYPRSNESSTDRMMQRAENFSQEGIQSSDDHMGEGGDAYTGTGVRQLNSSGVRQFEIEKMRDGMPVPPDARFEVKTEQTLLDELGLRGAAKQQRARKAARIIAEREDDNVVFRGTADESLPKHERVTRTLIDRGQRAMFDRAADAYNARQPEGVKKLSTNEYLREYEQVDPEAFAKIQAAQEKAKTATKLTENPLYLEGAYETLAKRYVLFEITGDRDTDTELTDAQWNSLQSTARSRSAEGSDGNLHVATRDGKNASLNPVSVTYLGKQLAEGTGYADTMETKLRWFYDGLAMVMGSNMVDTANPIPDLKSNPLRKISNAELDVFKDGLKAQDGKPAKPAPSVMPKYTVQDDTIVWIGADKKQYSHGQLLQLVQREREQMRAAGIGQQKFDQQNPDKDEEDWFAPDGEGMVDGQETAREQVENKGFPATQSNMDYGVDQIEFSDVDHRKLGSAEPRAPRKSAAAQAATDQSIGEFNKTVEYRKQLFKQVRDMRAKLGAKEDRLDLDKLESALPAVNDAMNAYIESPTPANLSGWYRAAANAEQQAIADYEAKPSERTHQQRLLAEYAREYAALEELEREYRDLQSDTGAFTRTAEKAEKAHAAATEAYRKEPTFQNADKMNATKTEAHSARSKETGALAKAEIGKEFDYATESAENDARAALVIDRINRNVKKLSDGELQGAVETYIVKHGADFKRAMLAALKKGADGGNERMGRIHKNLTKYAGSGGFLDTAVLMYNKLSPERLAKINNVALQKQFALLAKADEKVAATLKKADNWVSTELAKPSVDGDVDAALVERFKKMTPSQQLVLAVALGKAVTAAKDAAEFESTLQGPTTKALQGAKRQDNVALLKAVERMQQVAESIKVATIPFNPKDAEDTPANQYVHAVRAHVESRAKHIQELRTKRLKAGREAMAANEAGYRKRDAAFLDEANYQGDAKSLSSNDQQGDATIPDTGGPILRRYGAGEDLGRGQVKARAQDPVGGLYPKKADATGTDGSTGGKLSLRDGHGDMSSPAVQAKVVADLRRMLGDEIQVGFKDSALFSGRHKAELSDNMVRHLFDFSRTAPNTTGYHEALHGFFAELGQMGEQGKEIMRHLYDVSSREHVLKELRTFLDGEPEALKQLDDPEERVAYMFEMYNTLMPDGSRMLNLRAPRARGLFQAIGQLIQRMLKIWSDEQRAQQIMNYFEKGDWLANKHDPSAVQRALFKSGRGSKLTQRMLDGMKPLAELGKKVTYTSVGYLNDTGVPALRQLADKLYPMVDEGDEARKDDGYLQRVARETTLSLNQYGKIVEGLDEVQQRAVLGSLRGETKLSDQKLVEAANKIRGLLDGQINQSIALGMFSHLEKREDGYVRVLHKKHNYFPQLWDAEKIAANKDAFVAMLKKNNIEHESAGAIADAIIDGKINSASKHFEQVLTVGTEHAMARRINIEDPADSAPFLIDDLNHSMMRYIKGMTRAREYHRSFGNGGYELDQLLAKARKQGATEDEILYARTAVEGVLDHREASAGWRQFNNWAIAGANVMLLPLTMFSQLNDAVGLAARDGKVDTAFRAFAQGIKDIPKWLKDEPKLNANDRLAMEFGVMHGLNVHDGLVNYYETVQMTGVAKHMNDTLFKYNLVEGWSRTMRSQATANALSFIEQHLQRPGKHSARFMAELGLKKSDVTFDADGKIKADPANEKLRRAVHRYVDSVFLRPNAAQKPVWATDPRWAFIWHLKQFAYTFQHTFLDRASREASLHGNYAPAAALAAMVPVAAAGMLAKALITNGGSLPGYMAEWGPLDWAWNAIEKAGLHGAEDVWLPVVEGDPTFVAGPSVNLAIDALKFGQ